MISVHFQVSANLYCQVTLNGLGWSLTLQYWWSTYQCRESGDTLKVSVTSSQQVVACCYDILENLFHPRPTIKHMNTLSDPLYFYSQFSKILATLYAERNHLCILYLSPFTIFLSGVFNCQSSDRQTGTNKAHENFSP